LGLVWDSWGSMERLERHGNEKYEARERWRWRRLVWIGEAMDGALLPLKLNEERPSKLHVTYCPNIYCYFCGVT
jgi:hypothetical protein